MSVAVAVVGAAGSGKSTIARDLARRLGAAYLDKDTLAGPLVDAALTARGQSVQERESNVFYRTRIMPAEYEAIFAVARDNLELGLSVVIDAPFAAYLDQPDFFERASASWPEVETFVLRVFASEEVTRQRLSRRALPRDRAKLDDWATFWTRWGKSPIAWTGVRTLELENEGSPDLGLVLGELRRSYHEPPSR